MTSTSSWWKLAEWVGLLATPVLLLGLFQWPEPTLEILWNVVIPLIPASLLLTPLLWRNTCPLSTLNLHGNKLSDRPWPPSWFVTAAPILGIALFAALVPARRFLFNQNGPVLAITIVAVGTLAVLLGALFKVKSGFCNAVCPVLPVERLYGQRPILKVGHTRCCTECTATCIDPSPQQAPLVALGESLDSSRWLTTPFGAFAAGFPGFVFAYFQTADGPLSSAVLVYATVFLGAAASYAIIAVITGLTRIPAARILPLLAALAVGTYYWFAAPQLTATQGFGATVGQTLRVLFTLFVFGWWVRAQSTTTPVSAYTT
jgi:hypothetical protein